MSCFQDNCLYSLIQDFVANGICEGVLDPNPFMPPKTTPCIFEFDQNGIIIGIDKGTCSAQTETLLQSIEECGFPLRQQPNLIFNTLQPMLQFMCNSETVSNLLIGTSINTFNRQSYFSQRRKRQVAPLESVTDYGSTIYTNVNFGKFSFHATLIANSYSFFCEEENH